MEKLNTTVFLKVVETGSFKKAADSLGYTQAGISYIINAMEEEFGIVLFHREYGGVHLTPEGRQVIHLIRQIADWERYLQEAINDIRDLKSGKVRVCTFNSVYIHWLPGIIRKFRDRYPRIEVEIVPCEEDATAAQMICHREVDCGFVASIPPLDMDRYELMEESLMAVLPVDHPLAAEKNFPLSEAGNYPYILMAYDRPDFLSKVFKGGIRPDVSITVDNDYAALNMVSQGLGFCIFPQLLLNDLPYPVRCLPFDTPIHRTVCLCVRSMDTCTRATREFVRCAREWVDENDFSVE